MSNLAMRPFSKQAGEEELFEKTNTLTLKDDASGFYSVHVCEVPMP